MSRKIAEKTASKQAGFVILLFFVCLICLKFSHLLKLDTKLTSL